MNRLNRGVVLAGGLGTRMGELTRVINKHLLPVGDKPMIFYPIELMVKNGFDELLIVVGQKGCGELLRQLGDGSRFHAKFVFAYQESNGGIADALKLAEPWLKDYSVFTVILGDNVFLNDLKLRSHFDNFLDAHTYAHVFCTFHSPIGLFGGAVINKQGDRVRKVIEKPEYIGNLVDDCFLGTVTGLYIYDGRVFQRLKGLRSSLRGELEISDLNDIYAQEGSLGCSMIENNEWLDCGTPELYKQAQAWAEKNKLDLGDPNLIKESDNGQCSQSRCD